MHILTLSDQIHNLIQNHKESPLYPDFTERLKEGSPLTRDENPESHFCAYFVAYDPEKRLVFIGHHKKSGLWLFNGGHIDKGELLEDTVKREVTEEWGFEIKSDQIGEPQLITTADINNPPKQVCRKHYDIWFFVPFSSEKFTPDMNLLATEFHTIDWIDIATSRSLVTDPGTLEAITVIEKLVS